jgi:hypothetical protein
MVMQRIVLTMEMNNWRVRVFQRENGTYGLAWEHYSDDPDELCWIPDMSQPETFCADLETAEREARERIELLVND